MITRVQITWYIDMKEIQEMMDSFCNSCNTTSNSNLLLLQTECRLKFQQLKEALDDVSI